MWSQKGHATVYSRAEDTDRLRGMKSLVDAPRVVTVPLDLEETLKAIPDGLKSIMDYDAAAIYVVEPESANCDQHLASGMQYRSWIRVTAP